MSSWEEFRAEAPDLADAVRRRFDAHGHKTMATLRADGSPRISGTEVTFHEGDLCIGSMPDARKGADLRRDPRVAVHSGSDEPDAWNGDAKVAGRAVLVTDPERQRRFGADAGAPPGPFDLFRIDLAEVVAVSLETEGGALVIESWHAGRGYERISRT